MDGSSVGLSEAREYSEVLLRWTMVPAVIRMAAMTSAARSMKRLFSMGESLLNLSVGASLKFLVPGLWFGEDGGEGAVGVVIDGGDLDGFA